MQKLTKEQAIIISAYTGYTACTIFKMHYAVQQKLGREVFTHEFANPAVMEQIQEAFREDFLAICYQEENV